MSADCGLSIANLAIGADQQAAAPDSGSVILKFRGAKLSGGTAAATLTVYDGPAANNKILATLAAPTGGSDVIQPGYWFAAAKDPGGIHYTLAGTGATAQIMYSTG